MQLAHQSKPAVPRDKLIDLHPVCALCGVKKSTVYTWLKDPASDFPRPVRLGARMVRWSENSVLSWVQNRIHQGNVTPVTEPQPNPNGRDSNNMPGAQS
jgi:prophage regulatory protein